MKSSILLALVLSAVAVVSSLQIRPRAETLNDFPWMVTLRITVSENTTHFCGGSIVSPHWILTEANCFDSEHNPSIAVFVGANQASRDSATYTAEQVSYPPGNHLENDIALVHLAKPIVFNDNVKAVEMSGDWIEANLHVLTAGWGVDETNPPSVMKFVELKTISYKECAQRLHSKHLRFVKSPTICAVADKSVETCHVNAGSPLMHEKKLVGVASWINSCEYDWPDVFVRVSPYTDWIESITGVKAVN